jgi:hypothetical protein
MIRGFIHNETTNCCRASALLVPREIEREGFGVL